MALDLKEPLRQLHKLFYSNFSCGCNMYPKFAILQDFTERCINTRSYFPFL